MKRNPIFWMIIVAAFALPLGIVLQHRMQPQIIVHALPAPTLRDVQSEAATKQYVAALDVARVFGRSQGCENVDSQTITDVAVEALNDGLDPRILAATMAVESACDQYAVSHSGAVGRMQVMPRIWKDKFDFTKVNLFNTTENLHVGAVILRDFIKQYGLQAGVRHYNGTGQDCTSCDGAYVNKILVLAGRTK